MIRTGQYFSAKNYTNVKTCYTFVNGEKKYLWKDLPNEFDRDKMIDDEYYSPIICAIPINVNTSTHQINIKVYYFDSNNQIQNNAFTLTYNSDDFTSITTTNILNTIHLHRQGSIIADSGSGIHTCNNPLYETGHIFWSRGNKLLFGIINNVSSFRSAFWYILDVTNSSSVPVKTYDCADDPHIEGYNEYIALEDIEMQENGTKICASIKNSDANNGIEYKNYFIPYGQYIDRENHSYYLNYWLHDGYRFDNLNPAKCTRRMKLPGGSIWVFPSNIDTGSNLHPEYSVYGYNDAGVRYIATCDSTTHEKVQDLKTLIYPLFNPNSYWNKVFTGSMIIYKKSLYICSYSNDFYYQGEVCRNAISKYDVFTGTDYNLSKVVPFYEKGAYDFAAPEIACEFLKSKNDFICYPITRRWSGNYTGFNPHFVKLDENENICFYRRGDYATNTLSIDALWIFKMYNKSLKSNAFAIIGSSGSIYIPKEYLTNFSNLFVEANPEHAGEIAQGNILPPNITDSDPFKYLHFNEKNSSVRYYNGTDLYISTDFGQNYTLIPLNE